MTPIRKILLVIVEGATDERSIALALKRAYRKNDIYFFVYRSDMTTELGYGIADVVKEIQRCVRRFLSEFPYFKPENISAVIQITDTDGAYIPDDCVVQGENGNNTYELDRIVAGVREHILERNRQKSTILTALSKRKTIPSEPILTGYLRHMQRTHRKRGEAPRRRPHLFSAALRSSP